MLQQLENSKVVTTLKFCTDYGKIICYLNGSKINQPIFKDHRYTTYVLYLKYKFDNNGKFKEMQF